MKSRQELLDRALLGLPEIDQAPEVPGLAAQIEAFLGIVKFGENWPKCALVALFSTVLLQIALRRTEKWSPKGPSNLSPTRVMSS